MKVNRSRPSPAMLVAALALTFALVGTALAAPDVSTTAITKGKVRTVAKKQANKAINQRESSLNVNSAKTADSADNAQNLGGSPASAYASSSSEAFREVGAAGQPAFENGWTNFGVGYSTAAFYKDSLGVVHLKGTLSGTSGTDAFTLPAGYRPTLILFMPSASGGPEGGNTEIHPDGSVRPYCESACSAAGLDGLSFRATG